MSQESSSCQSDEIGIAGNPELSTSGDLAERKDFGEWLQFVSQCLKGHPNMTSARRKKEEMFEEKEEKEESEEERCMRVVKSVLDEETVLEMATDFLQMTREPMFLIRPFFHSSRAILTEKKVNFSKHTQSNSLT